MHDFGFDKDQDIMDLEDKYNTKTSDALVEFFGQIAGEDGMFSDGYGIDLELEKDGYYLKTKAYCWCEHPECAYCSGYMDHSIMAVSKHSLFEKHMPRWKKIGFVEGQGAPNFYIHDENRNIKIRIWWHKYIGRGMEWLIEGLDDEDDYLDSVVGLIKQVGNKFRKELKQQVQIQKIEMLLDVENEDIINSLGSNPELVETLYKKLTKLRHLEIEMLRINKTVGNYTSIPAVKRNGEELPLSWRVVTAFSNPEKNIHKPKGQK